MASLQVFDEEAECRQMVREVLEFSFRGRRLALGEGLDPAAAVLQHLEGAILAEHGQHAFDLPQRRGQAGERALAFGSAEIVVEGLLDLRQIDLHLARELAERHALLGFAGGIRQVAGAGIERGQILAGHQRLEARFGTCDLGREIGVGDPPGFQCGLGQHHCGCHFQADLVVDPQRILAQPLHHFGEGVEQMAEGGTAEWRAGLDRRAQVLVELGQAAAAPLTK